MKKQDQTQTRNTVRPAFPKNVDHEASSTQSKGFDASSAKVRVAPEILDIIV